VYSHVYGYEYNDLSFLFQVLYALLFACDFSSKKIERQYMFINVYRYICYANVFHNKKDEFSCREGRALGVGCRFFCVSLGFKE